MSLLLSTTVEPDESGDGFQISVTDVQFTGSPATEGFQITVTDTQFRTNNG